MTKIFLKILGAQIISKLRHIGTTIMAYLRMLPEIEMCAAQQIGRYLSNLHRMASDLGYLNFRENLATVWGPIFLKVEPPAEPGRKPCTQSACDEYEAAVEVSRLFSKLTLSSYEERLIESVEILSGKQYL